MRYLAVLFFFLMVHSMVAQNINEDTVQARILYNKAHYLQQEHQQQAALKLFEEAGILYKKHKEYKKYFNAQNRITTAYRALSDHENAIRVARQVVKDCQDVYGEAGLIAGEAYVNVGISQSIQGNFDLAAIEFQKAVAIFKEKKSERQLASVYNNLGIVYYYKGEFEVALQWYKKYELLLVHFDDASGLAGLYGNTGALYSAMGDNEEALEYIRKSLEVELQIDASKRDWLSLTKRYANVSVLCRNEKQLDRAMEFIEKAEMTLAKLKQEEHPYFADLYSVKAAILADEKKTEEALQYYEKEMELLKKNNASPLDLSVAYSNLAAINSRLKKFDKGFEYADEAIRLLKEKEGAYSYLLIRPYTNKAGLYAAQGDFENFMLFFEKIIQIGERSFGKKHPQNGETYTVIASELSKQQRYEEAFEYLEKAFGALVASEETDVSKIIQNKDYLDLTAFRGYLWTKAHAYLEFYEKTKDKKHLDEAYQGLLWVQETIEAMKNNTLQSNDKKKLLSRTQNMSADLLRATCLYEQIGANNDAVSVAFAIAERNKSTILLEALRGASAHKFGNLPDSLHSKENELKEEIAAVEKKILDAHIEQQRQRADTLKNQLFEKKRALEVLYQLIGEKHPNYVTFKQGKDIDVQALQDKILDDETALMEYYVTDSACYQFVLSKKTLHLIPLSVSKHQIDLKMIQFRRAISDYKYIFKNEKKAQEDYTKTAYWFYEQLIQPAEAHLSGIKKLIVIPDYTLGHLPFEAFLMTPPKEKESYNDMDYLLHHYSIRYSYSAALLLENQKHQHQKKYTSPQLLAFAAAYNSIDSSNEKRIEMRTLTQQELRKTLKPLPAVQSELEHLERIFPQGNFYYGNKATEAQFKATASQANILHLAMHGILNQNNPIASSLVFTEDGDSLEDNFLYTYEISQMTLPMDLVVLSACETGYGKFEWGEGVMSMARSFMYAGVPSLVVSLWQVNDASTAIIMEGFYENLNLGMPKDVALSTIKKDYLKHAVGMASHPAYWAPFIQLGDAQAMTSVKSDKNWLWIMGLFVFVLIGGLVLKKQGSLLT